MSYFAGMLLIMMHVVMGMPAAAAFMAVLMGVSTLFLVGMTATAALMAVLVAMFALFLMGMPAAALSMAVLMAMFALFLVIMPAAALSMTMTALISMMTTSMVMCIYLLTFLPTHSKFLHSFYSACTLRNPSCSYR